MAKHDNKIAEKFQDSVKDLDSMSEQDLLDRMNETIKAVEVDESSVLFVSSASLAKSE